MSAFLDVLVRASLQGALFIAAVWLVCRLFPRLPASVRCGLWWVACLKLLVGLVWVTPVELPVLPAVAAAEAQPFSITNVAVAPSVAPNLPVRHVVSIPSLLVALWLAGLLSHLAFLAREVRRTRRIVERSEPVREGWIAAMFAELRERLGLSRPAGLRGSADVDTPQAVGLVRPLVLLPSAGLEGLSPSELSMTLCHELAHVRRKDLWLGWVPALAHKVFFFHPLAALAAREYALAREAACDAEVLRILGTAPRDYGRLLLRWGVAPRETGLAAAGASPSLRNLKRRLQMLQHSSNGARRPSAWWWLAGAAALTALIPFQMVAQEETPEAPEAAEVAPAPEAPPVPELPPPPAELGELPPPPPAEAPELPGAPAPLGEVPPVPPAMAAARPGEPVAVAGVTPEAIEGGVLGGVQGGVAGGVRGGVAGGVAGGVTGGVAGGVAGGVEGGMAGGVRGMAAPHPASAPVPGVAPAPRAIPAPGAAPKARPGVAGSAREAYEAPPAPPAPPKAPKPPKPPKPPAKEASYRWSVDDDGESWILFTGKNSVTMSGSSDDYEKVKRLYKEADGELLWFRRDGKEYVIRDAATLKAVKDLWKPVTELGKQQAKLGAEQAKLGAEQARFGGQQAALGAKQAALGAQMAALSAEQAHKGREAGDAGYERKAEELSRKMEELGRQQEELGRQQEKYSEPQEELGRQQEALGRKQDAASKKAEKETRTLLDRSISNGVAQPVG